MLETINNNLLKLGYISYIRRIDNKNCIYSRKENDLNSIFFIYETQKKLLLKYSLAQIPIDKEFKTADALLDFVKEIFPIEK